MDITANALKNMKSKQLRKIIREAIEEVLNEGESENKAAEQAATQNHTAQIAAATAASTAADAAKKAADAKKAAVNADKNPGLMEENDELDEMARLAKGFKLADPNIDAAQFTKSISGTPLSTVIEFFRENPGAEKTALQQQFNFVRPQIANAIVNGLLDAGVLTKLSASGEEEAPTLPGEEAPTQASEPEDLFMGSAENPLSMYFDNEPNADGTEDMNDEEEPTTADLEKAEPTSMGTDKEKAADFIIDNSRLITSIINNYATFKSKIKGGGEAGGISSGDMNQAMQASKTSAEAKFPQLITQMVEKIKQEEPNVQKAILDILTFKFTSVNYPSIAKKIAKELNMDVKVPTMQEPEIIEPEETETIDEVFDDYEMRKRQFYAGIIK